MRRWLRPILPVAAIALWLQVLAPVMAWRTLADSAAPLISLEFCRGQHEAGSTGMAPSHRGTGPDRTADHACCVFCAVAQGGAMAPVAAPGDFVVLARAWQRVAFRPGDRLLSAERTAAANQARAPPVVL